MEKRDIDRINDLARKAKQPGGLTETELAERQVLRRRYIDSVLGDLRSNLDNVYLVDENGKESKLKKKDKR